MVPDEILIERLAGGDREALGPLFERHRDFVFRVALGLTGRREEARDVVQEVFLALMRRPPALARRRARLSTWLYRVARNRCADRRRARKRSGETPRDGAACPAGDPEAAVLASERRSRLDRAVRELPPRPREVFVLRVGLGLSVEETARLVGCRAGAVRTALHTASRKLRSRLSGGDPEADDGEETRRAIARG